MRRLLMVLTTTLTLAPLVPASTAAATSDPVGPEEMLWIYELNLIRWNPGAYGIDDPPSPPLAVSPALAGAAGEKAQYMVAQGYCGHDEPVHSNRLADQHGFPLPDWWSLDANYVEAVWCSSGPGAIPSPMAFIGSSTSAHRGIVLGRGGYSGYREVGVGYATGTGAGFSFFAAPREHYDSDPPRSPLFITGVVFDDTNGNGRMDLGEGVSGATVTASPGSHVVTTNAGGGYSIQIDHHATGTYTVSSPGAGSGSVTLTRQNVSVDFVVDRSVPIIRSEGEAERWWGDDRYGTAVSVSQRSHPGGSATVFIATGENYPDAVGAGAAAGAESAPILLTTTSALPAVTRDELIRLAPDTVIIVGGPSAVSSTVVSQVADALDGVATIVRRWGDTRYETAVAVSKGTFGAASTVFVATGENYPDALVATPAAVLEGAPLLLVRPTSIPSVVGAELERLHPARIIVLGGSSAVSSNVFEALKGYSPSVERIAAPDRHTLSAEISKRYVDPPAGVVYVAIGSDYPDALAGGAATATASGPVLLVEQGGVPSTVGAELLRLAPHRIVLLGGPAAVPTAVAAEVSRYLG